MKYGREGGRDKRIEKEREEERDKGKKVEGTKEGREVWGRKVSDTLPALVEEEQNSGLQN